ncbi:MAG: geranyl transferase [Proteobacteria bacterium]|nr:geranyl transferase [Pseudomonadota bacterium]|tara:strand:- start:569 stop:1567 length:999 start_codon:yes stop_codon:yes gene_type:complete
MKCQRKTLRQSNDGRTTLNPEAEEKALKLLIDENIKTISYFHEKSMADTKDCSFSKKVVKQFWEAIAYGVQGGKRLRGILVFAAAKAVSKREYFSLSEAERKCVLDSATAIECVHAFSLVHDDLPVMDNDKLRRGKNTLHVEYDEATALLVGDALQTLGTEVLCSSENYPERRFKIISVLSKATGASGMAGGQMIDVCAINKKLEKNDLEIMHKYKTGALFEAAVSMGYLAMNVAHEDERAKSIKSFMSRLGVGFQVVDDILDAVGVQKTTGKEAGRDKFLNKPNFVELLGVEYAKEYASECLNSALKALEKFGGEADFLRYIANRLVKRSF